MLLPPPRSCVIAFWLVPVALAAFIVRRVPLAIWCAAAHLVTYVLLREAFNFTQYYLRGLHSAFWVAYGVFTWVGEILARRAGRPTIDDGGLNGAFLAALVFAVVGIAFSHWGNKGVRAIKGSGNKGVRTIY
jgi:hypothetical protein